MEEQQPISKTISDKFLDELSDSKTKLRRQMILMCEGCESLLDYIKMEPLFY